MNKDSNNFSLEDEVNEELEKNNVIKDEQVDNSSSSVADTPLHDIFNTSQNTKVNDYEDTNNDNNSSSTDTGADTDSNDHKNGQGQYKGKVSLGKLISGKLAVTMADILIPSLTVWAFYKFGYKMKKSQMKLSVEEKNTLIPVVQDCLDWTTMNFDNPYITLGFVVAFIYGSKVFDAMPEMKEWVEKQDKDDDDDDNNKEIKPFNPQPSDDDLKYYRDVRNKINATSIRKTKISLVIDELMKARPQDIVEAYQIYSKIWPERTEQYFRDWYKRQINEMPDEIKFDVE